MVGVGAASDMYAFAISIDGDAERPPPLYSCFPKNPPNIRTWAGGHGFRNARNRDREARAWLQRPVTAKHNARGVSKIRSRAFAFVAGDVGVFNKDFDVRAEQRSGYSHPVVWKFTDRPSARRNPINDRYAPLSGLGDFLVWRLGLVGWW